MVVKKFIVSFLLILSCGALTAVAQTTVSASVYGAYRSSTSKNTSIEQRAEDPANSAGFQIAVRHIKNSWIGYEGTYSFNPANENYWFYRKNYPCLNAPVSRLTSCSLEASSSVHAVASKITGDWVFSFHHGAFRPFALIGAGVLIDVPTQSYPSTSERIWACSKVNNVCIPRPIDLPKSAYRSQTDIRALLVYGVGWDWTLSKHFGLRFQYRGAIHKSPGLSQLLPATNQLTQDAEPMIGLYYQF